jgi:hypothetical protein
MNLQVSRFGWISGNLRSLSTELTEWIGDAKKMQMGSAMITFLVIWKILGALSHSWQRLAAPYRQGRGVLVVKHTL